MNYIEKLSKRKRVYAGKAVHFSADEIILPDGRKASREYMEHPGAVAVLPFLGHNRIILVKQYRYPIQQVTYELPAGKLDENETLAACVKRELEEETGYRAGIVKKLLAYWPTPAFSNEVIHLFYAEKLKETAKAPDDDEFIDHIIVTFDQALAWVRSGKIRDSKTVIGLLYWAAQKKK